MTARVLINPERTELGFMIIVNGGRSALPTERTGTLEQFTPYRSGVIIMSAN